MQVRELKRLKRDREEEEQLVRELEEAEKFRNLTEDEKRLELRVNPKQVRAGNKLALVLLIPISKIQIGQEIGSGS